MDFSFKNKYIAVTGAGNGIGRAVSILLAEQNATVIGIDKNLNIIMDFNTEGMYRGYKKSNGDTAIEIYK